MSFFLSDAGILYPDGSLQATASYPALPELLINPCGDIQQRASRDGLGILKDRWIQSSGVTNAAWTDTGEFSQYWQLSFSGDKIEQRIEQLQVRRAWQESKQAVITVYMNVITAGTFELRGFVPSAKDDYTSWTQTHTVSVSLSTGLQRLVRVITLPDTAYQRGFQITLASTGAAVRIPAVSMKPGAIWTPFVQPDLTNEMLRCRRFYKEVVHSLRFYATGASQQMSVGFTHEPYMRATPIVGYASAPGYQTNLATGEQVTTGTERSYRYEISSTQAGDIFVIARVVRFDAEIR